MLFRKNKRVYLYCFIILSLIVLLYLYHKYVLYEGYTNTQEEVPRNIFLYWTGKEYSLISILRDLSLWLFRISRKSKRL